MRGGSDEARREGRSVAEDVAQAEEFLYHLHRGSDLLLKNKVLEAKEELERALQRRPQDAKSQDLLAGVYFRLGVYPRAIEIWGALVAAYPQDVALRVNLALAYFKTAMVEEAADHIHSALRLQPDHERAWGYLGLVHWRRGRIQDARDAFLRAGQTSMARRMEEILAEEERPEGGAELEERSRAAADDAAREISDGPAQRPVHVPSRVRVSLPPPSVGGEAPSVAPAEPAAQRRPDEDERSCRRESDGTVNVRAPAGFAMRLDNVVVAVTSAATTPVYRRVSGADLTVMLGGDRPLYRAAAPVEAFLAAPTGQQLHVIRVDDSPLIVLESRLVAFTPGLDLECNTLALDTDSIAMVRLQGKGEVVVSAGATVRAVAVGGGREARLKVASLVGYSGALFASPSPGVSVLGVVLRGEGTVLVA